MATYTRRESEALSGRARALKMYSASCPRITRILGGPKLLFQEKVRGRGTRLADSETQF